jgi:hypothetical protein
MKRPDLLILVVVWEFIAAFIALIVLAAIILFAFPSVTMRYQFGYGPGYVGAIFGLSIVCIVLFVYFGISIASGIGVLIGKEWGRIISIVQAALSLFSIPFGTIIGVLVLVYLTRVEVRDYFVRRLVPVSIPPATPSALAVPPDKPAP